MTQHILKPTFTRGELSPLAHARQDIDTYLQGAARVKNFSVLKFGGARRRSGTVFRAATKFADKKARFFKYVYSNDQAYLIEFGHLYARFWVPEGLILSGGVPYEIVTPYTEAQAQDMDVYAVNDDIFIAHPDVAPQTLTRVSDTNWTLTGCTFRDGPYYPINEDRTAKLTVTTSPATGASVTFTWDAGIVLTSNDVGRGVRAQFAGKWVWGYITAVSSPLIATVNIVGGVDADSTAVPPVTAIATGATSRSWRLANISPNHPLLRPSTVCVSNGRVIWGSTYASPRGVMLSMADYKNRYSPSDQDGTVADNHGFSLDILTGGADPIQWIRPSYSLQVASASGIRTISGSNGDGISPRDVAVRVEVNSGSSDCQPVQIGPSTLFMGRSGQRLHDMVYDYQVRSLTAPVISLLSEHLLRPRILQLAYQEVPDSIVWGRTGEGKLLGVTYERFEKVIGFHDHDVGGFVEQVETLPNGGSDEVWLIVRRVINGQTVRYVETLEQSFEYIDRSLAYFVDCGKQIVFSTPANVVPGLGHLEGQTVDVLADGAVMPQTVVSGGQIVLPNGMLATNVNVGLPIDARLELLRTPSTSPKDGTVYSRRQRLAYIDVDVFETAGLSVISDRGQKDTIRFRTPGDNMGAPPPLFTGVQRIDIDGSWAGASRVTFVCDQPLPATIRAILLAVDAEP